MGGVLGGKMKKYRDAKEETCIYLSEMRLAYPDIYG